MTALQCVLCLYVPCHTDEEIAEFRAAYPPDEVGVHDGLAVTVTGGNASCECHLPLLTPDDVSALRVLLRNNYRAKVAES